LVKPAPLPLNELAALLNVCAPAMVAASVVAVEPVVVTSPVRLPVAMLLPPAPTMSCPEVRPVPVTVPAARSVVKATVLVVVPSKNFRWLAALLNQVSPEAKVVGSVATPPSKLRPATVAEALNVCLLPGV